MKNLRQIPRAISIVLFSMYLISCTRNPLGAGGGLPNGFHPGLPVTDTPPTVTSILPISGTKAGGTAVTITGTGFVSGAVVSIGNTNCGALTFVSATTLTCTTPAHLAGQATVLVTNPDALTASLTNGYSFLSAGTSVTGFVMASGGGVSANVPAGIHLRGTAGISGGNPVQQSGGAIKAYPGIQNSLVKP